MHELAMKELKERTGFDPNENAASTCTPESAGWVCSKVKDELTMLRNYIGITPKSLLSDRQDMMKRVDRILSLFGDKPNV